MVAGCRKADGYHFISVALYRWRKCLISILLTDKSHLTRIFHAQETSEIKNLCSFWQHGTGHVTPSGSDKRTWQDIRPWILEDTSIKCRIMIIHTALCLTTSLRDARHIQSVSWSGIYIQPSTTPMVTSSI